MRKFWAAMLSALLIFPMLFQSQAQAAVKFNILIDGVRLTTSQAPVMIQGRVMLPMRAIFEALDAKVKWNQKTQTVTAVREGTTIVLKINSKTATINNQSVRLDVPAKNLRGATMVPVRFVSESLGEKVGWNSKTKTVSITTTSNGGGSVPTPVPDTGLSPASNVTVRDIANNGDGRDLQVSFSKSYTESRAAQYQVMIVKAEKSYNFNQSAARMVPSSNYSVVFPTGSSNTVTLTSGSRDIDGDYIRENQAYKAYVLTAGRYNGEFALSSPSSSITLSNSNAVETATNVKGNDVNDYGDGRDLSVSFTRAQKEDLISNYRIMVVKTKDVSKFDLAAAKSVPSQYYTTVYKTSGSGTTLTNALSSSTRDTSGEYIKNGVPYTLFVMSVSSNENTLASKLSSGSSSITLATGSTTAPVITQVTDVSNYGDGRDLRVNFNKLSDESGIGSYRIFVVKSSDYHNFNLNKANSVSSSNYTQVNKTGYNITQTLSSGARDIDGSSIRNGVYYRVFVMSVGSGNNYGNNNLSSVSSDIILSNNNNNNNNGSVGSVYNLYVNDVGNNGDGRDLQVSFNRPSDENNISHYRAFVVKSHKASNFDLYAANNSSYYTDIYKTGSSNIIKSLSSGSRDTDGDYIRNGTDYRVFILSVGNGNYSGNNALSSYSSIITLSGNSNVVKAVSNLNVTDNGQDLKVSFTRSSDEYNISHYRALFVKSSKVGSFKLSDAIYSSYYTRIDTTGYNITKSLSYDSRDTDGDLIRNGGSYRLYILSVGNSNYSGDNAMTSYGSNITLSNNRSVDPVSKVILNDIGDNNDGRDLQVSFERPSDDSNISEYRTFFVKAAKLGNFDLSAANSLYSDRYTVISKSSNSTITKTFSSDSRDTDGDKITKDVNYNVFIMSVNKGSSSNALTTKGPNITLTDKSKVAPVTDLNVVDETDYNDGRDFKVTFTRPSDEKNIDHYRVFVVNTKTTVNFDKEKASSIKEDTRYYKVSKTNNTVDLPAGIKDTDGADIKVNTPYSIFVLSVSNGNKAENNALSIHKDITLKDNSPVTEISAPTKVNATVDTKSGDISITFETSNDAATVSKYHVMVVPVTTQDFNLAEAVKQGNKYAEVEPSSSSFKADFKFGEATDVKGNLITTDTPYNAYVLAVAKDQKTTKNVLSNASNEFKITNPAQATIVTASVNVNEKDILQVNFNPAAYESNIDSYEIMIALKDTPDNSWDPKKAATSKTAVKANTTIRVPAATIKPTGKNYSEKIIISTTKDAFGENILSDKDYKVVILSVNKSKEVIAVSKPSTPPIPLKTAAPVTPPTTAEPTPQS
ncbi:stalk domain-containing protein [Paenibacillus sp. N3/727]|uniref:copper amine oxidase N-terminal domain-containing protein n=1 Tax=Paenibacillus sp. N3/727 TaxID=2925845 RepID=UPI001F53BC22|nr:copper amine oxidase N-terminal domain-containing protein [Paenibacillus sp. N3/727]UNK19630.1 stalk domain-containing protein [Paenibacillus sp. N3/727]